MCKYKKKCRFIVKFMEKGGFFRNINTNIRRNALKPYACQLERQAAVPCTPVLPMPVEAVGSGSIVRNRFRNARLA